MTPEAFSDLDRARRGQAMINSWWMAGSRKLGSSGQSAQDDTITYGIGKPDLSSASFLDGRENPMPLSFDYVKLR